MEYEPTQCGWTYGGKRFFCQLRTCPKCSAYRSWRMSQNLRPALTEHRNLHHVTLTMRQSYAPLRQQIQRLYGCFAALKRRAAWKRFITGGAWFLDITHDNGEWNAHLHLILESDADPAQLQTDLAHLWLLVTDGDGTGENAVDVRPLDSETYRTSASRYICKPPQKSFQHDPAAVGEYARTMKGRRLFGVLGTWRRKVILLAKPATDGGEHTTRIEIETF